MSGARRWNHNIQYHRLVLRRVPVGARDALDIGCGDGMLARRLRGLVCQVVGIDADRAMITLAAQPGDDVAYVCGDFLHHPFAPESYDVIASVATLHHMDATEAITRMRALLRPGGTLVVVGLARPTLRDAPHALAGAVVHRAHLLTKQYWEPPAPKVWPPPETYASMRRLGRSLLPGARFRRHALWRYSIVWSKPRS